MKIYFDNIIFYLQKFGGISVYWNELILYVKQQKRIDANFIEFSNSSRLTKDIVEIPSTEIIYDRRVNLHILRYLPFRKKRLNNSGIFHSSYYRYSTNSALKNIITIYDFTYERHRTGLAKLIHHWQKKTAIKHAVGIICISENTKKDLLLFYPFVNKKKIKVIYLSCSDLFQSIADINIEETNYASLKGKKILSFVGNRTGYKNFSLVINILKQLDPEYHLLIVGGGGFSRNEIELLSTIEDRYSHILNVDSAELNIIYNLSFCYLYLSEYEGFGIPIIEAHRAGCPVLCQKISSIPEVYGGVDNIVTKINDISQCCTNIKKLEDLDYRSKIIQQGFYNSQRFSWEKTCSETIDFYKYIIHSSF